MSTPTSRRVRKALESRDRLVECAATLFADRGYTVTTMEEIGECADVSRATVFNYFPRKEDLVVAWFDGRRAILASVLAPGDDRPEATSHHLRHAFRVLARIFTNNPRHGRGMVRAWLQAGGPLFTATSETTRLFADAIRAGQRRGDIARDIDPDRTGHLLFDAYLGELIRWVTTTGRPPDLERGLQAVLDLIIRGIAAPPAERP